MYFVSLMKYDFSSILLFVITVKREDVTLFMCLFNTFLMLLLTSRKFPSVSAKNLIQKWALFNRISRGNIRANVQKGYALFIKTN